MSKKTNKIIYVDDDQRELKRYKKHLESTGEIVVIELLPKQRLDVEEIIRIAPALVLIDIELDQKQPSGEFSTYKGTLLAASIRENLPEIPIVLLSRGSLKRSSQLEFIRDFESVHEFLLLKEDLSERRKRKETIVKLLDLVEGFQELRSKRRKDKSTLLDALGARKAEWKDLRRSNIPSAIKEGTDWRVAETAKWVRDVLLKYPGILYNSLHSSVALGIDEEAFLSPKVQAAFQKSKYSGIFSKQNPRWWKRRLLQKAAQIMEEAELEGSLSKNFSVAWKKSFKADLRPSICIYSRREHADCVCYLLNAPVLLEYSLPYTPDERPPIMDEARISYKSIRLGMEDELNIPEEAQSLADNVRNAKS